MILKTILTALISVFLVGTSSDKTFVRLQQESPTQTGTLQKMIVANGSVAMEVDLNLLNGGKSQSQLSTLNFATVPNSFFTILVFNDELRGAELGSLGLVPQNSADLPAALNASLNQLVIQRTEWTEPFELVVRDGKTGFTFFNIEGNIYNYDARTQLLSIKEGRLLLSKEFAAKLPRPSQEGSVVGTISINASMRSIEITQVVNGEARSSVMPPSGVLAGTVPGPDVIVGDLSGLAQFGSSSGTQVGLAVATDSCNAGVVPLNWLALPNNDHPVIPQNLYRMSGGATNDDRFEQIGQSNVKHAFTALQQNICGFGCSATGSTTLGSGCSDPYSASLNAGTNNALGSRAWINPFTGAYPRGDSATPPNTHTGHTHTGPSHRILVEINDLNTSLNAGATYYAEAQYVTPHEYAWCVAHPGECNMYNNASNRRFTVTGTASPFSFTAVGSTVRSRSAITNWPGATINRIEPDPGNDGIGYVAYKVTNPSPGVWHYEYAVYNQNLDRAIQSFSVPSGGTLSNIGFHAPPQHPGWSADGTVGNAGYSSTPWTPTQTANALTWTSETLAQNPNANAIRWGTLYNFRFDSDRPPQVTNATVGFFKTGAPILVPIQAPTQAPSISINDVAVTEGNSGTSTATFTVFLSPASSQTVTVQYATANNTASSGSDYLSVSGTATFAPGETSKPVGVTVNGDTQFEPTETFNVNLTNPTNATIGDSQGVGTITNDDGQPTISINDVTVTEGNGGTTTAAFTVSLSNASTETITVNYATAGDTATSGTDFVATSGTATITPGLLSTTVNVTVNGDTTFEPNESFFVNLASPINATISDNQGLGTINNDDGQPTISISDVSVTEGNSGTTNVGFTVSLSNPSSQTITVNYATADGSAAANGDYVSASGTVTFTPGQLTQPINVTVNGDTAFEANETFNVNLSDEANATISDNQGLGTINNDDAQPTISINDASVTEGNAGTTSAGFTVSLSNPSSQTITVNYATADDSATAGSDYATAGGMLTFTPGQTSLLINVTISGDITFEPTETFTVNLSGEANATISDNQGLGTISNDDAQPTISINDVSLTEGNTGTSAAGFTVSLSNPSSQTITVNYATADNTATAGSDYLTAGSTLTFTPGQTSQPVSITVNGDTMFEPNETFTVNLSGESNATISDNQGVGTISNDDAQPTISINDVTVTEGNAGTTSAGFTVSLSNPSSQTITVNYAVADNTATAGSDYLTASSTLTFTPGQLTQPINVTVNGDTTFEANETFNANLSGEANATISDNQGVGTISNDDAQPTISINDVSVSEGNAGTSTAGFTVSLSNPSYQTITVNYATADNTATAGSDYLTASGTVSFTPGQTSQPVSVTVNGDTTFEANESFNVNLSGEANATIADNQAVGTISNDDAQPTISINDVTHNESNAGTTDYDFIVSLSNASSQTITVNAATADDTATTADSDYTGVPSALLTFSASSTTPQHIHVLVNGDTKFEPTETFFVNLSGQTNATLADGQGVGAITNDDAQPTISINDVSVTEGNTGTITAAFSVSLSVASSQTVTVHYATADGSAAAGSDYLTATGSVTFTAGQLTQPISVTVNGDTAFEPNETFNVNLSAATNATVSDNQGLGTVTNDDTQPTISINDLSVNEGDAGTTSAGFTVSLSNASYQTITVNYATADNTAKAGTDYLASSGTLTFIPEQTSQPLNITINSDLLNEETPLTFNLNLSASTNATIADNQGVGTIVDDDAPVLATEQNSQRAIALDAITFVRDPFAVANLHYFGTDKRTRITLFVTNLSLTPGLVVTARAVDSQQMNYALPVEYVGSMPPYLGYAQVVVKLPDGIVNAGDLQVSITVRGRTSNSVLVGVTP